MKEGLRVKYDISDEEVKTAMIKWFKKQSTEFYKAGINVLFQRWNITIKRNSDYAEK